MPCRAVPCRAVPCRLQIGLAPGQWRRRHWTTLKCNRINYNHNNNNNSGTGLDAGCSSTAYCLYGHRRHKPLGARPQDSRRERPLGVTASGVCPGPWRREPHAARHDLRPRRAARPGARAAMRPDPPPAPTAGGDAWAAARTAALAAAPLLWRRRWHGRMPTHASQPRLPPPPPPVRSGSGQCTAGAARAAPARRMQPLQARPTVACAEPLLGYEGQRRRRPLAPPAVTSVAAAAGARRVWRCRVCCARRPRGARWPLPRRLVQGGGQCRCVRRCRCGATTAPLLCALRASRRARWRERAPRSARRNRPGSTCDRVPGVAPLLPFPPPPSRARAPRRVPCVGGGVRGIVSCGPSGDKSCEAGGSS